MKLYHNPQANFAKCHHFVRMNNMLIPSRQLTLGPMRRCQIPSLQIVIIVPAARIYYRLSKEHDFKYANDNVLSKIMCVCDLVMT